MTRFPRFQPARASSGRGPWTRLAIAGLLCLCAETGARAADPEPFPDFTFRTVRPPDAGAKKRITVQIAPPSDEDGRADESSDPVPAPDAARGAATPGRYGWFWEAVSPARAESGPGRLDAALQALAAAPESRAVRTPRLSELVRIARDRQAAILGNSAGTRVSPALALAVIAVESGGDTAATSSAGAQGLMQLMPDTALRFGVADPFDGAQNIAGGIAFLDALLERFEGDPVLALAGYNAGEGALARHDGVPDFAETRDYVPKVLATFAVARALCITPPVLISDGCVFRLPD